MPTKKKVKLSKEQVRMSQRYEKAWNKTVEGLDDYKKSIIINNFPYERRVDREVSNAVVREAVKLAESDIELN